MTINKVTAAYVHSVHLSARHSFSKQRVESVSLLAGWGVEGDAHAGSTDQHLYHVRRYGRTPNLNQVHLLPIETLKEVGEKGFVVLPGELGENICTRDIELLALPTRTRLHLGPHAILELTGLRDPCSKIEKFRPGLLGHLLERGASGVIRKCGVMGVVIAGGEVRPEDPIELQFPPLPQRPLSYIKPSRLIDTATEPQNTFG